MNFIAHKSYAGNGNDFITKHYKNCTQRHNHFKYFLYFLQDHRNTQQRKTRPNFKIDTVVKYIQKVSTEAWRTSVVIYINEQKYVIQKDV